MAPVGGDQIKQGGQVTHIPFGYDSIIPLPGRFAGKAFFLKDCRYRPEIFYENPASQVVTFVLLNFSVLAVV